MTFFLNQDGENPPIQLKKCTQSSRVSARGREVFLPDFDTPFTPVMRGESHHFHRRGGPSNQSALLA